MSWLGGELADITAPALEFAVSLKPSTFQDVLGIGMFVFLLCVVVETARNAWFPWPP